MSLRAICDLSYALQAEAIERRALAEMTIAPHLEDPSQVRTPDLALAEFQRWLVEEPKALRMKPEEIELYELIGVSPK